MSDKRRGGLERAKRFWNELKKCGKEGIEPAALRKTIKSICGAVETSLDKSSSSGERLISKKEKEASHKTRTELISCE